MTRMAEAMSAGSSAIDWISLAIGAAALALACLSLGWQCATFFLSGERVKASLKVGGLGPGGAVLMAAIDATEEKLGHTASQGYGDAVLAIEVRNVGRLSASVTSWSVHFDNGMAMHQFHVPINPPVPYLLEPGHEATWYASMEDVWKLAQTNLAVGVAGKRQKVWMSVKLGRGKSVATTDKLPLLVST